MLGAHLDSVLDGPGLNDDGSGVAALLAIARALQGTRPRATVRLAFWSGEELGLLGSSHYVAGLSQAQRADVVAYLNADMMDHRTAMAASTTRSTRHRARPRWGPPRCRRRTSGRHARGRDDRRQLRPRRVRTSGYPHGRPLLRCQRTRHRDQGTSSGATAGQPADACYHQACDGLENVDLALARQLTTALADVTVRLANTPELLMR